MTAPAPAARHDIVFFELVPEYIGDEFLPTCPDGSGDLWWDQASYIRYQAWDGPTYHEAYLITTVTTPDYCNGIPQGYGAYLDETCDRHKAEYDNDAAPF
jgi:hypothetical protein